MRRTGGCRASPTTLAYRENSGRVEATWAGHRAAADTATPAPATARRTEVLLYPNQQTETFRYMFEKLADKAAGTSSLLDLR